MLLILADKKTNRLKYIAGLMLSDMLGLEVSITTSADEFRGYDGMKLAYTREPVDGCPGICPSGLLSETGITEQETGFFMAGDIPVLYPSKDPRASLPFDPFSAGFYMVSRYEEYLPHQKDRYGRFVPAESVAWKGKFLDKPVVHLWSGMIGKMLAQRYPMLQFRQPGYRYLPTIDIDHAYCYLCRKPVRTMGGIGRSLLRARFGDIYRRMKVLTGQEKDPFDTYGYIREVYGRYGIDPLYFVLFADYGGNDNNVSADSKTFHSLLRELDRNGGMGIHPSLSSNKHYFKLKAECEELGRTLGRDVTASRQHFLKQSMPKTYRSLLKMGIREDYSMGYASVPGFRAGMAIPFHFFDIQKDETTALAVHPIIVMDVTMRDYLRLNPEECIELAGRLVRTVKSVNGTFISLWHNESLCETGRWQGWRKVFEEMARIAAT